MVAFVRNTASIPSGTRICMRLEVFKTGLLTPLLAVAIALAGFLPLPGRCAASADSCCREKVIAPASSQCCAPPAASCCESSPSAVGTIIVNSTDWRSIAAARQNTTKRRRFQSVQRTILPSLSPPQLRQTMPGFRLLSIHGQITQAPVWPLLLSLLSTCFSAFG
jgi:hypothetical protein